MGAASFYLVITRSPEIRRMPGSLPVHWPVRDMSHNCWAAVRSRNVLDAQFGPREAGSSLVFG